MSFIFEIMSSGDYNEKMLRNIKETSKTYDVKNWIIGVLSMSCLILGSLVIWFMISIPRTPPLLANIRLAQPNDKLISHLLLTADNIEAENVDIENKLKLKTYDLLNNQDLDTISIYYRDLKTGSWAGVNQNMEYDPASLLKVPVMIAWYKKAQEDPSVLTKEILFKGDSSDNKDLLYNDLQPGTYYTVDELINTMIIKSDNDSLNILRDTIDPLTLLGVYTDLGIESLSSTSTQNSIHISPSIYSRFIRILYNATYLNDKYSEKALELLSHTDFNNGIVAGVPSNLTVAHKFGQYQTGNSPTDFRELHDCGIVYHPLNPYVLCVMTRGTINTSLGTFESVLQTTSKIIYSIVNNASQKES